MAFPCFPDAAGVQPLALVVVFPRTRSLPALIVRKCFLLFALSYSLFDFVLFFSFKDKCRFTARKETGYVRDYLQDSIQTQSRSFVIC